MLRKTSLIMLMSLACFLWTAAITDAVYAVANSRYSLSGAEYQLYTDSACTTKAKAADGSDAILITDENGDSNMLEMVPGTYYAREIKPGRGYKLDAGADGKANVYMVEVTASNTEDDPASFTSGEPPAYGVPEFMVFKTDLSRSYEYTKLIGAKFTVKYYDVETKEEIAGAEPKDEWTFKTVKKPAPEGEAEGSYMAGFDWQHDDPVSCSREGEKLFYEVGEKGEKRRVLPLGWFTIEETEAPAGFKLTDRICYGHVYQPKEGGDAVTEIEGAARDSRLHADTLFFGDEPYPEISTNASIQNNNREVKDAISYKGLIKGKKYVFRGWLVDTATGEKIPGSDGSVTLTAESGAGEVGMILKTDKYDEMKGHSMTAFEELYAVHKVNGSEKESLAAEHKDLKDKAQTVEIYQDLKVKKNVTGNLGDLSKVFEYSAAFTGLKPGEAYTVEGSDSKSFVADPSGKAAIPLELMDDQSVTIKNLPKGATYRITEKASDHVAEYKAFSEDMAEKGARIIKTSDSNGADAAKDLATALETVDMFDGTVVIVWENNRDLATVTAVQSYMGIWASALVMVLAGMAVLLIKHTKYKED